MKEGCRVSRVSKLSRVIRNSRFAGLARSVGLWFVCVDPCLAFHEEREDESANTMSNVPAE